MSDVKSEPRKGAKSAFELGVPKTFREAKAKILDELRWLICLP